MSKMFCAEILGLKLDSASKKGLEKLTRSMGSGLTFTLSVGTIALILIDAKKGISDLPSIAFNIEQTAWDPFFKALDSIESTKKHFIEKDARLQAFDHMHDPKQELFWN